MRISQLKIFLMMLTLFMTTSLKASDRPQCPIPTAIQLWEIFKFESQDTPQGLGKSLPDNENWILQEEDDQSYAILPSTYVDVNGIRRIVDNSSKSRIPPFSFFRSNYFQQKVLIPARQNHALIGHMASTKVVSWDPQKNKCIFEYIIPASNLEGVVYQKLYSKQIKQYNNALDDYNQGKSKSPPKWDEFLAQSFQAGYPELHFLFSLTSPSLLNDNSPSVSHTFPQKNVDPLSDLKDNLFSNNPLDFENLNNQIPRYYGNVDELINLYTAYMLIKQKGILRKEELAILRKKVVDAIKKHKKIFFDPLGTPVEYKLYWRNVQWLPIEVLKSFLKDIGRVDLNAVADLNNEIQHVSSIDSERRQIISNALNPQSFKESSSSDVFVSVMDEDDQMYQQMKREQSLSREQEEALKRHVQEEALRRHAQEEALRREEKDLQEAMEASVREYQAEEALRREQKEAEDLQQALKASLREHQAKEGLRREEDIDSDYVDSDYVDSDFENGSSFDNSDSDE